MPKVVFRLLLAIVIIALAHPFDAFLYEHAHWLQPRPGRNLTTLDLGRMVRIMGYAPLWLLAALALLLQDWRLLRTTSWRLGLGRAWVLTAGVGLTAIAVEVLKLLVRRQRPDHPDGIYSFRAWSDRPFDTGGLAFPSSHAAIAFAGAWVMCRLFPRAAPIWLLIGVGCAWERLATGSHFLSDVTASAALAYFVTWPLLYRRRLYLDRHREELHASGEYSI